MDRGVWDHELFARDEYSRREAWLWLVASAVWKDQRIRIKDSMLPLSRGQCAFSLRFLATKWGWSKDKVARFMRHLEIETMIETQARRDITIITICNYEKYQSSKDDDCDTERDTERDTTATQLRHERDKEEQINKLTIDIEEGGARAVSKITDEAITLAQEIGAQSSIDPDDPSWLGFPYIVQMWLAEQIPKDFALAVCSRVRVKNQKYFDKAVRSEWRDRSNLPTNGNRDAKTSGNILPAQDRLLAKLAEFDRPAPADLRGGAGEDSVRLLSKG